MTTPRWGRVPMFDVNDVDQSPGAESGNPEGHIVIVQWPSQAARQDADGTSADSVASYFAVDDADAEVGRMHFVIGTEPYVIVHEVTHATLCGERALGEIDDERMCRRADRLFLAISEFLEVADRNNGAMCGTCVSLLIPVSEGYPCDGCGSEGDEPGFDD